MRFLIFVLLFVFPFYSNAQQSAALTIHIDPNNRAQQIDNFGAAGAWFSEGIGKNWPTDKREQMAEWLFSKELDKNGNPKGIGLSAWRFNIGGGTAEQGDSSGIIDFRKRVECFLKPDGTYDWSKQAGYIWFTKKAQEYGVENLIAFSNTPPVQFTKNGLGYKTEKDYQTNLKPDKYGDYARFLADVLVHFDKEGLHFNYISPVNEPQWDWSHSFGKGTQEGSPWQNEDIAKVTRALDSTLTLTGSTSRILITEAGQLDYLYGKTGGAAQQAQLFFGAKSPLQLSNLKHMPAIIGGHSYFTDKGDSSRIAIRKNVADTTRKYGADFWQTEYSMLADGYKEGKTGKIPAMDCALFLSKVIHDDLVYGNAKAWQLWNSWEPGSAEFDIRYFLIALNPANKEYTDGSITATKTLWAMGHYSRFVRPGMHRLTVKRNDNLTPVQIARNIMVTAYSNEKQVVLVAVNYTEKEQTLKPELTNFKVKNTMETYLTAADKEVNMLHRQVKYERSGVKIPARSLMTIVFERK
ncbi:glycoside hydrolase [Dyadobacter sediminis]|uniref:Beta-glycosidase n=1 Tax=Dyadobacter sediminis TaxID=1493691 RepID=A0A5R9K8K3_9BACT|nr:glycoside hydrolase [Dyadobacter sediminis]TLU90381.1 beta-glycosidase [Dyadobacter sediminis]GGC07311.1 xylanase [Dyadobacter sediminis]